MTARIDSHPLLSSQVRMIETADAPIIDKCYVHKYFPENVLLSWVRKLSDGEFEPGTENFLAQIHVNTNHSFFFEHPRNHLPGLYLIEAGRQMGVAVSHMFYDISFDTEFAMMNLGVSFNNMANLFEPVMLRLTTSDHVYKRGQLISMYSSGVFSQGDREVARIDGRLVTMSKGLMKRLERRGTGPTTRFGNSCSRADQSRNHCP